MRAQLPLRFARAAAFSAVCVILATLAHVAGGGSGPEPWAAGLGLAVVAGLGMALCGRERSPATINGVLAVAQLGLHELFAGDDTAYVSVVSAHGHGGGLAVDAGMVLAHLTASLITGVWLARGEAALWSLLRRLGRRFVLLRPVAAPAVRLVAPVVFTRVVPPQPGFRHCLARRGPPLPA
ncbi:MFS transporter [Nonomuraea sp. 3N208]|uniref:MFS transporter n=1 Tax=Nonomuraea sp. 3N208 TaxID=3457421 RepID=UPI003FCEA4D4